MHYIIYLIAALILQSVPVRDSHEKIKEEKKRRRRNPLDLKNEDGPGVLFNLRYYFVAV